MYFKAYATAKEEIMGYQQSAMKFCLIFKGISQARQSQ